MRYLSLFEVLELHEAIIASSGGLRGIRDIRALESAINQPRLTFDQTDLYPDLISKATALCFSLVMIRVETCQTSRWSDNQTTDYQKQGLKHVCSMSVCCLYLITKNILSVTSFRRAHYKSPSCIKPVACFLLLVIRKNPLKPHER
jgi:hypothetical protein